MVEMSRSIRTAAGHAFYMHRHARPAIERGCSIGANHAQNRQLMSSGPTTRVAIARFSIIRACFNKRYTQAFPKADRRSNIRTTSLRDSNIDGSVAVAQKRPLRLMESYR
jgi:hypothetical protein